MVRDLGFLAPYSGFMAQPLRWRRRWFKKFLMPQSQVIGMVYMLA